MTSIVSWNIQYGKGVDGRIDFPRIANVIKSGGEPDVICLQEIAVRFPALGVGAEGDQVAILAQLFPNYRAIFYPALEWLEDKQGPRQFGNMILSRLPIYSALSHPLPRPADASTTHMQRHVVEVIVQAGNTVLRIATTHLEYYSLVQRTAQTERLRALEAEWVANDLHPPRAGRATYIDRPRALGTIWCGDFNFPLEEPNYTRMLAPIGPEAQLVDAWVLSHDKAPHAPTCGVHDHDQWAQGPHARDFFFVSANLSERVIDMTVDTQTDASDHQPIWLTLRDI